MDLNKADALEPNDPDTLKQRGVTKKMMNDIQGAFADLSKAVTLAPHDTFAKTHLQNVAQIMTTP
jgi:regulator of sirC expression with transglutaminase-like and TPR domain